MTAVVQRDIMVIWPEVMAGGFQEVREGRRSQWLFQQLGETFQQEAPKSGNKKGNQSEIVGIEGVGKLILVPKPS